MHLVDYHYNHNRFLGYHYIHIHKFLLVRYRCHNCQDYQRNHQYHRIFHHYHHHYYIHHYTPLTHHMFQCNHHHHRIFHRHLDHYLMGHKDRGHCCCQQVENRQSLGIRIQIQLGYLLQVHHHPNLNTKYQHYLDYFQCQGRGHRY